MADFSVSVVRISHPVENHPDADRLSLVKIGGYTCISAKLEDGSHRYKEGDHVVYVPESAVVPEWLLRKGFWDDTKGKGILAGSNGDRVKAIRLRGVFSQGILFPLQRTTDGWALENSNGDYKVFQDGDNVAAYLGVTKYEPPIPQSMSGEVANAFGAPVKFDFESIQRVTDLFEEGELVEATEKLHGTFVQIGYVPDLNHAECFYDGNVYVASKGLGAQGLVFKNNDANAKNVYVRTLCEHLDRIGPLLANLSTKHMSPIRLFGEIFGRGIQDLHYGSNAASLRLFDICIGERWLTPDEVVWHAAKLGLERVPSLYQGPFDVDALAAVRDGKDTLSGSHVREGIVIRSASERQHPIHGRKIGKWVSPDYLLRKGNTTELQ